MIKKAVLIAGVLLLTLTGCQPLTGTPKPAGRIWHFAGKITPKRGDSRDRSMRVTLDIKTHDGSHLDLPGQLPIDTTNKTYIWDIPVTFATDVHGQVDVKFRVQYWDDAVVVAAVMPVGWVIECAVAEGADSESKITPLSGHSENKVGPLTRPFTGSAICDFSATL